jgi:hypothetical protein
MPRNTPSPTDAAQEAEYPDANSPHVESETRWAMAGEMGSERTRESMLSPGRGRGGAGRPGGEVEMTTIPHNFSPSRDFLSGF